MSLASWISVFMCVYMWEHTYIHVNKYNFYNINKMYICYVWEQTYIIVNKYNTNNFLTKVKCVQKK